MPTPARPRRRGDPWAPARANALARGATLALQPRQSEVSVPPERRAREAGAPSKTEERYRLEVLEPARIAGEVLRYQHQPPAFVLGYLCVFHPDYRVEFADGTVEIVDVKGFHVWEDATVKIKWLASIRPDLRCVQVHRLKGGGWRRRVIPGPPYGPGGSLLLAAGGQCT